jgi:hypothetical protein
MAMLRRLSWQKVKDTTSIATGKTIMSTKSTEAGESRKPNEKSGSTKASWQSQEPSAMTKPSDGKPLLIPQTVLIVPSEEELKDLLARLQDLMRSWQSPKPMLTNDYVVVAFPIKGNKIGMVHGSHGNVFTVNDDPVTPVMADDEKVTDA